MLSLSGKMRICGAFLVRPGIWGVATCDYYILLFYDILALMLFYIMTWAIAGVA